MIIANSIADLIGATPLVKLGRFPHSGDAALYAKLEFMNPTGSIKDRIALGMILDAEQSGRLAPGCVIVEPTSGNTGIGLAAVGMARGYSVILTMPETMSRERRLLLSAYGAKLVLTDGAKGMRGAIMEAERLAAEIPNAFMPAQFDNPANPQTHYNTTGPEILRDLDGKVDVLVAGVGTGGTLTGVGGYLKKHIPNLHIVAVEPSESPVLSGGQAGPHGIQGIGAGFIPSVLDVGLIDEIMPVSASAAYAASRALAKTEGFLVGVSSGAALSAASNLAARTENGGKNIVVILPDTGERYLSTPLFE